MDFNKLLDEYILYISSIINKAKDKWVYLNRADVRINSLKIEIVEESLYNFISRWFFSINHKDIDILYIIFGEFSGVLGKGKQFKGNNYFIGVIEKILNQMEMLIVKVVQKVLAAHPINGEVKRYGD